MQGIADVGRIESTLFARHSELVRSTSFVFSIAVLIVVLGGFGWFLSVQYEMNAQKPEEKRIPFVPTVWYSATRNVRNEEYAGQLQPFEIETRYGVSRPTDGSGPTEVHGVDYGSPAEGGGS
jgi:cytoskeletal protein RodZ